MLDRPERRNALNRDMWAALPQLIQALDAHPETRVLVIRGAGSEGLSDLLHAVSLAFAKEMLFTARRVTAEEALRAGLIHRVVAADRLAEAVTQLCAEIADNAPLTIKASKRAIDCLAGRPVADDPKALAALCFASADYAEGQCAFLEKRKPRFTGG